jgi:uncharacterized DUF497 family protein
MGATDTFLLKFNVLRSTSKNYVSSFQRHLCEFSLQPAFIHDQASAPHPSLVALEDSTFANFSYVPVLMLPDSAHSQSEPRYHALGKTIDGRRLHITFTLRSDGKLIRVISARDMHRKERAHYEQATQNNT